ncbi:MAG: hypothetical protein AAF467_07190 [Actinomycetota bacterium]
MTALEKILRFSLVAALLTFAVSALVASGHECDDGDPECEEAGADDGPGGNDKEPRDEDPEPPGGVDREILEAHFDQQQWQLLLDDSGLFLAEIDPDDDPTDYAWAVMANAHATAQLAAQGDGPGLATVDVDRLRSTRADLTADDQLVSQDAELAVVGAAIASEEWYVVLDVAPEDGAEGDALYAELLTARALALAELAPIDDDALAELETVDVAELAELSGTVDPSFESIAEQAEFEVAEALENP